MPTSKDNTIETKVHKGPLSRFLERKNNVRSSTPPSPICNGRDQHGEASSGESERCAQRSDWRSSRRTFGIQTRQTTEPRRGKRFRKSKTNRSTSTPPVDVKISQPLKGHCCCGKKEHPVYSPMCEDCYSDYAQRWSGKDQAVMLYW